MHFPPYGAITRGSSPLARGLHPHGDLRAVGVWIIPARAGFTFCVLRLFRVYGDHPRSRGVYRSETPPRALKKGSSPLARGLRLRPGRPGLAGGIIPARAGFTVRRSAPAGEVGDHPRSRGVYASDGWTWPCTRGSSPLARGLLPPVRPGRAGRRIIPARAGFTLTRTRRDPWSRDHPRSRGVYPSRAGTLNAGSGSSPLARGLLTKFWEQVRWYRIIPARAGFTRGLERRGPRDPDHPRSRGVYPVSVFRASTIRGSSPLARGLHHAVAADHARARIIPARAGFTDGPRSRGRRFEDHPRSRGVYKPVILIRCAFRGSSPLARGLHQARPDHPYGAGIIPARAGFTPGRQRIERGDRDHPRSRGVYEQFSKFESQTKGSSPLARGLL